MTKTKLEPWQEISNRKREEQRSRIPKDWQIPTPVGPFSPIATIKTCGILSAEELSWTDTASDFTTTLQLVATGKVSTEQLITAFCKRAAVAHCLTNCLTEILFNEAIERAKELDRQYKSTGKVVGPLHGLPISVKDHLNIEGFDSSAGFSALCFEPAQYTSKLVQLLVQNGAVVIAKTNVPQTCLAADTINVVFGRTTNAYKNTFGAAGSSGGEGAIVAMGGSLLGIGSDGAGSIRMPAGANGVVGYKPSAYRLPADGRSIFGHGFMGTTQLGPVAVFGFLGRSTRDVLAAARIVSNEKPWEDDPFVYPSPWLGLQVSKPRIGIWKIESPKNLLHLHPPVKRGFLTAQDRLRKAGYELVEFDSPDISHAWDLCKDWVEIQGLWNMREYLSKEPYTKMVRDTGILIPKNPRPDLSLEYLHDMNLALATLTALMAQAWTASRLDAILWVTAPHTALPLDQWTDTTFTSTFNAIDWPALSLPLDLYSDKKIDVKENIVPFNDEDARVQALYDPESFDGLPLNVQLIGRRFEDEKLLNIAEEIHPVLRGK